MASKVQSRYIQFYTDGTAAKQLITTAPALPLPKTAPAIRKRRRAVIYLDPVAVLGIVVAVIMLITMLVGVSVLNEARAESSKMAGYLSDLANENADLQNEYYEQYDADAVRQQVLAMGFVPIEEAARISVPAQ